MTIVPAITNAIERRNFSREETREIFNEIMGGQATSAQIAAFLVALRMKGETIDEITGAAEVMREKATRITPVNVRHLIDTCGTGGDGAHTFNISTAAAFVAAGAGAVVAKHGNRSVSSKCGSADVLEALGVNIAITPDQITTCLDQAGIGFLFATSLHCAMKHAIGPRKEIGVRTIFNILGPLTNPAGAKRQLVGVFSPALTNIFATVLAELGAERAYVVHGLNGMDEISLGAETQVSEVRDGTVKTYTIKPEDFGFNRAAMDTLRGDTAHHNAAIIRSILSGEEGPRQDIVVLNAGFALCAAGISKTPVEGIAAAKQSITSGAAMAKLEHLIRLTNNK